MAYHRIKKGKQFLVLTKCCRIEGCGTVHEVAVACDNFLINTISLTWKSGSTLCSQHHFPGLYESGSCVYVHGSVPLHMRKTHWEESLIYVDNFHPSHHQKRSQTGREFVFVVYGVIPSLDGQSPFAWLCYSAPERRDFRLESDFYQCVWCARYPLNLACV